MIVLDSRDLDKRVRIERPLADDSFRGAGHGAWEPVATVWANVQDVPPSRSEQPAGGMPVSIRRSRVRMRHRADVVPAMRIVLGERIMQIVGGPAELGRRSGIEVVTEEYASAGNPA